MRTYPNRKRDILFLFLTFLTIAAVFPGISFAVSFPGKTADKQKIVGNYDIRVIGKDELAKLLKGSQKQILLRALKDNQQSFDRGLLELRTQVPQAEATFSPFTAGPEVVRSNSGSLSGSASGSGRDIVVSYLNANHNLYGLSSADIQQLQFIGESISKSSGLRMVRMEQRVNGLRIFQSETRFILDRDGRIVRTLGLLVPNAAKIAPAPSPVLSGSQALQAAMKSVGINADATSMSAGDSVAGNRTEIVTTSDQINGKVTSELMYYPLAPGILVPAYLQVTFTRGKADWTTVTDANTGIVLWRKNIRSYASNDEARFSVYVQADGSTPADSPAPASPNNVTVGSGTQFPEIARTTVNMLTVQDITASPDGWIPDGGNTTTGNNTDTYLDTDADNLPDPGLLDNNGRPVGNLDGGGNNRDFLGTGYAYAPPPVGGNPDAGDAPNGTQFQRGAVTQLFYLTNWYHDQLYELGFDEAAGNFQTDNFGNGGVGGDPVLAEAQDGLGTNNANFATPPDGTSGRMQMFLFDFPTPQRDGILDSIVVLHELTHGLSNRLVGDGNGLLWDVAGGMGEGWSDFVALSLTNNTNADDPNGQYPGGAYATYQLGGLTDNYLYGIRRFPYSTNNAISPLTWADVDDLTYDESGGIASSPLGFGFNGGFEVHNIGEIWASSLWEVRSRIIADPAGANGDVPTGNHTMLQLTVDALKLTPINPSFLDARDAFIDADCATNSCANEQSIWSGFADRGLGYGAAAPLAQNGVIGFGASYGLHESFNLPNLDKTTITIDDSVGGNNDGAADPGETIVLTIPVFNPWRNAAMTATGATGTLTASTGVTIVDGTSNYGSVAPQATVTGDTYSVTIPGNASCGQAFHFVVATTSSLGPGTFNFDIRVGTPAGPGTPVTYMFTPALVIPDGDPRGVNDTQIIPDDFLIDDVNVSLNSVTHTWTGDVNTMITHPNQYGAGLSYLRGVFVEDGNGDNFTNTVFDDQAEDDLNLTGIADAPYTGSFKPAFNGDIWGLFGIPNFGPDPVGQLSRMNGLSSLGAWTLHVADLFTPDSGTLNSWSLTITPETFTCVLPPCLFCDEFDDSTVAAEGVWTYKNFPFWAEDGNNLIAVAPKKSSAIASPVFTGCTTCSFNTSMSTSGNGKVDFFTFFTDKKHNVDVSMLEKKDVWRLKVRNGTQATKAKFKGMTIDPNTFYNVSVTFDGTNINLIVDSQTLLTVPALGTPFGTGGFGASNTTGTFDFIHVLP